MNILMVDDMKTVHTYLKSLIGSEEDWQLGHAYSGEEALELLDAKSDYDLILLDWEMPGMDGLETLEHIQNKWPQIPVIMVTSRNSTQDFQKVIEKGASEYVIKPFTKDILFSKIATVKEVG